MKDAGGSEETLMSLSVLLGSPVAIHPAGIQGWFGGRPMSGF